MSYYVNGDDGYHWLTHEDCEEVGLPEKGPYPRRGKSLKDSVPDKFIDRP